MTYKWPTWPHVLIVNCFHKSCLSCVKTRKPLVLSRDRKINALFSNALNIFILLSEIPCMSEALRGHLCCHVIVVTLWAPGALSGAGHDGRPGPGQSGLCQAAPGERCQYPSLSHHPQARGAVQHGMRYTVLHPQYINDKSRSRFKKWLKSCFPLLFVLYRNLVLLTHSILWSEMSKR